MPSITTALQTMNSPSGRPMIMATLPIFMFAIPFQMNGTPIAHIMS